MPYSSREERIRAMNREYERLDDLVKMLERTGLTLTREYDEAAWLARDLRAEILRNDRSVDLNGND